ncbi:hypothetical protein [Rathayibacter sp. AY1F3]|uniref:hypothetical protein n=1 Tax=Rathayibacter sp. AY1F3 TaxID=2080558 RepID=UPI0015E27597|nr:hypothetical protein [Rathayibacter sp. AY1F3]
MAVIEAAAADYADILPVLPPAATETAAPRPPKSAPRWPAGEAAQRATRIVIHPH